MTKPRKTLNVFISQPMRGRTDEEILKERQEIMSLLGSANPHKKTWDLHIIDSFNNSRDFDPETNEKQISLHLLGESIQKLGEADFVILARGWEYAKGCRIEFKAAVNYGITVCPIYTTTDSISELEFVEYMLKQAMKIVNKERYSNGNKQNT